MKLTDAGLETVLVFEERIDLPHFAAFPWSTARTVAPRSAAITGRSSNSRATARCR